MAATVVSIINLKGGVGKSTLTMLLAEFMAFRFSKNVLLIDMDAQANLSFCMVPHDSIVEQQRTNRTTYDLFKTALKDRPVDIRQFITHPPLVVSNIARNGMAKHDTALHMVVSTPSVAQLDEDLLEIWQAGLPMPGGLRQSLATSLAPALADYDYVLIDCPPGLSLFSSAALIASDYFVSPVIPEPLSLQGVELVQRRVGELPESSAEFKGVILNVVKHYRRTHDRVAEQVYSTLRPQFMPFGFWLPDSELVRKLGEFDPDDQGQWALGVDRKFASIHHKYSVTYPLMNPRVGALSRETEEGAKYKLEDRMERLVIEFMGRCP